MRVVGYGSKQYFGKTPSVNNFVADCGPWHVPHLDALPRVHSRYRYQLCAVGRQPKVAAVKWDSVRHRTYRVECDTAMMLLPLHSPTIYGESFNCKRPWIARSVGGRVSFVSCLKTFDYWPLIPLETDHRSHSWLKTPPSFWRSWHIPRIFHKQFFFL